jgi:peptidoglycan/xylan/chitin deacetylase (PgdA/CDA1 family)
MSTKSETNITIFCYHQIDKPVRDSKNKGLFVAPEHFEWQIKKILKHGFEIVTFEDIVSTRFSKNKPLAILTIDDGCESIYLNALPILKKYQIKAVVYLITGLIGEEYIISQENPSDNPERMLTKDQIREMADYGIEFGSHLCQHIRITRYPPERIKYELSSSKEMLENFLNKKVLSVAYPFGDYNEFVLKSAKEAGYSFGVTTKTGANSLEKNLELCRIPVKGYALRHYWYFRKKLRLAINQIS